MIRNMKFRGENICFKEKDGFNNAEYAEQVQRCNNKIRNDTSTGMKKFVKRGLPKRKCAQFKDNANYQGDQPDNDI
jgi:hypothetical protein